MITPSRFVTCVSLGLAAVSSATLAADAKRPNVVLIYADDLGYGDLACYGGTAPTPATDRLAKEGLRHTGAYCTSATCTPSRYSLLTGEYAWRQKGTGILPGDAALIIKPGRTTIPSVLKQAGYSTGVVGKWHLGLGSDGEVIDWNKPIKPGPNDIGFDYSYIMAATADRVPCVYIENRDVVGASAADPIKVDYQKPFAGEPTGVSARDGLKINWSHGHNNAVVNGIGRIGFMTGGKDALWVDEDMADVFARQAVSFIEKHKDEPFFLYFATHDIHVPRVPHPRFVGKTTMGARGDAIVQFDWQVGQVLETLDRLKLAENTLVIVTSDNGPVLDDGYVDGANEKLGTHKPAGELRGGKYSRFEGGTRVATLVRWPGGNVKASSTSGALISQVDFVATLAAVAGQSGQLKDASDSTNQVDALLGRSEKGREHVIEHANRLAIRVGDWKYIEPGQISEKLGPWKRSQVAAPGYLFNLAEDPGEESNVAEKNPEKVKELGAKLESIRAANAAATAGGN